MAGFVKKPQDTILKELQRMAMKYDKDRRDLFINILSTDRATANFLRHLEGGPEYLLPWIDEMSPEEQVRVLSAKYIIPVLIEDGHLHLLRAWLCALNPANKKAVIEADNNKGVFEFYNIDISLFLNPPKTTFSILGFN